MCGRYTLTDPGDLLSELGVTTDETIAARYNAAPTQEMPAVRAAGGDRELVCLRWGLIPFWAKDETIGNRMINARAETLAEKPSFRNALKKRRCVLLADGFYEWKKVGGGKQPYHIHFPGRRPFVFAGLWEHWSKGPEPVESFTIVTTEANETLKDLHHRMPVILAGDALDLWLDPGVEDSDTLGAVLGPWRGEELETTAVSKLVNSPTNDRPEILEPVG